MICKPCQLAADIMEFAPDFTPQDGFRVQYVNVSYALHDQCVGGTHCVCQHQPAGSLVLKKPS